MVEIQEVAPEKKLDKTTPDVCSIDVINDKTLNFQINYDNLSNQESKEVKEEIKQIKELKEEERKIDNSIKYDKVPSNQVEKLEKTGDIASTTREVKNTCYKNTMNDEWREWVKKQINNKMCLKTVEARLKKQNYSQDLINSLLYTKSVSDIKSTEIKKKNLQEVVNHFPNTFLEIGDFFPFIKFGSKELYNLVDSKFILLVCVDDTKYINYSVINMLNKEHHVFVIYNNLTSNCSNYYSIKSDTVYNLLEIPNENINLYILNANRRIVDIKKLQQLEDIITMQFDKYDINIHVPYLLIDNVLNQELLDEVIAYYDNNPEKRQSHYTATKNRLHVHPDRELELKIDNKLSRSVFPEVKKIFYLDVRYRESYKICSYNSETNGKFHPHRDTVSPHQHRKYAMSLLLNDDYEGGEFELPEYNLKLKPKANSVIIFPGICSHKVLEVTKGTRRVIISFLCNDLDDDMVNHDQYKMKSNFYDERKVNFSKIYPF